MTIAQAFDKLLVEPLPLRFTAYDGSVSGRRTRRSSSTSGPRAGWRTW